MSASAVRIKRRLGLVFTSSTKKTTMATDVTAMNTGIAHSLSPSMPNAMPVFIVLSSARRPGMIVSPSTLKAKMSALLNWSAKSTAKMMIA